MLPAAGVGGLVYAIAGSPGFMAGRRSRTLWAYDPVSDSWSRLADLPHDRVACAAGAIGNHIYVAGGIGGAPTRLTAYDWTADTWEVGPPMSAPREHLAAAVGSGRLFVIGGRWSGVGNVATVEANDPARATWQVLPPMPTPRGGLAAAAVGDRIYVTGGEELDGSGTTHPAVEVYDPGAQRWHPAPALPTARHGLGAATVARRWYVIGVGRTAGLSVSGAVERFDPASSQQSVLPTHAGNTHYLARAAALPYEFGASCALAGSGRM
ncbi:MAG: galactose oxidase [Dehalococcoidia bacterium]|nr:galactose oxidase [Dehalococcoidia bacterium]